MVMQQAPVWEVALVAAITEELDQLRYLVENRSGATEAGDVRSQLGRLCSLTDLAHNEAIPFGPSTRLQIQELNEMATSVIRNTIEFPPPSNERVEKFEREAAQALFDAIALNLPNLVQAETSKHAIALSTSIFDSLRKYMGSHPEFEMMERLVLVQDYRVMRLAGDNR